jgi:hypothetical protein
VPKSKLALAHERAARVAKASGGSILVGLSGKDSFCTLDIASEHFERIACFHMYYVRGLECYERPLQVMCERYHVKLCHVPHFDLCRMLKHAVLRPHIAEFDHFPQIKKSDCERLARKRSGISWIAYGERLSDCFARRLFWRKLDGIYEQGQRCTFIVDWLDRDVAGYCVAKKFPAPCRFGADAGRTSEFALTPKILGWLKTNHPDDFDRVLRVFPGAQAQIMPTTTHA